MRDRKRQERRKKMMAVLAIILALAMVFSVAAPLIYSIQASAMTTTTSSNTKGTEQKKLKKQKEEIGLDKFSLDMAIGYDQQYIVGKATPFRAVLTNKGKDFSGEMQIKVYSYEDTEGDAGEYSIYYQPVELAKGAAKQMNLDINVETIRDFFEVILLDEQGKMVFRKNVSAKALDPATVMVGVLTDNPGEVAYLSGLNMTEGKEDYEAAYSKTVFLNGTTFPESKYVLGNFKAIIIEDFDTKTLTKKQKDAIENWTRGGGMLIFGTGPKAEKVLGGLDELAGFQMGESQTINSFPSINNTLQIQTEHYGSMDITPITAPGLKDIFSENGTSITSAMAFGSGKIVIHNFSLSLAPAAELPNLVVLLRGIYSNEAPSLFKPEVGENYERNYISRAADQFPVLKTGSIYGILGCILVYIVVVGPILYIVLKKKDKREFGWVAIPVLSILFMAAIFLLSQNSHYKNGIVNIISATEMTAGSSVGKTDVSAAIKSAKKGAVVFSMEDKVNVMMPSDDHRNYYDSNQIERYTRKILAGDTTEITYFDNKSWETNTFSTEMERELGGTLESTVTISGNHYVGKILNHTNLDFYGVVLGLGGTYQSFGKLKAGESLDVDYTMENLDEQDTDVYSVMKNIYGDLYDRQESLQKMRDKEMTQEEIYSLRQQMDILENCERDNLDGRLGTSTMPIVFYGFNDEPVFPTDKYVNGKKAVERNLGFYQMQFDLDLENTEHFDIPFGIIAPALVKSEQAIEQYSHNRMQNKTIYAEQQAEVECIFELPKNVKLELFQIRNQTDGALFYEAPQIFNMKTERWEKATEQEYRNPMDYITEQGNLTVKLFLKESAEAFMPGLRLKGGGNHAGN